MKTILFLMRRSRRFLWLAVVAGVVSGAANTALLAVINAGLNSRSLKSTLGLVFVGLCLIIPVSRIISELLLAHLGQEALFQLRLELAHQILAVPLRRLEELGPHRLMAALTDDIPTITNTLADIPVLCVNVAVAISCLFYMAWLSVAMFLAVAAAIILGIISYQLPVVKSFQYLRMARQEGDHLYEHFRALTEGIKELKIHSGRRKAFLKDVLQVTSVSFRQQNISGLRIYTIAASWGQLLVFVVIGLLVFVLADRFGVNHTVLTGFTLAVLYLTTPLQVIMNALPDIGRANVALKNVEGLGLTLVSSDSEKDSEHLLDTKSRWDSLELKGVTHAYRREGEENTFLLGPIDLTLRQGELVFLTGGNGSGKTTLAKLIIGLYSPEQGEIRFKGERITEDSTDAYRQLFSVVFSDFYLFDSLLGLQADQLDAEAHKYLATLHLDNKVSINNGVLSTTTLSQGQRKRLALLTAYLEDRPIYVFDEWAADQDPQFREIFYYRLLPDLKAQGKTVLVISHDDSYYHIGDRIIKLDYGRVFSDTQIAYAEAVST
jgi:putative ATP-binding cassette transporter